MKLTVRLQAPQGIWLILGSGPGFGMEVFASRKLCGTATRHTECKVVPIQFDQFQARQNRLFCWHSMSARVAPMEVFTDPDRWQPLPQKCPEKFTGSTGNVWIFFYFSHGYYKTKPFILTQNGLVCCTQDNCIRITSLINKTVQTPWCNYCRRRKGWDFFSFSWLDKVKSGSCRFFLQKETDYPSF